MAIPLSTIQAAIAPRPYRDRQFQGTDTEYQTALEKSTTLYVGNMSVTTNEEHIWALLAKPKNKNEKDEPKKKYSHVKRIIMGRNKLNHFPCQFLFIEFFERSDALQYKSLLNGFNLHGSFLKVDVDWGFKEGRQYGRGFAGGSFKNDENKFRKRRNYGYSGNKRDEFTKRSDFYGRNHQSSNKNDFNKERYYSQRRERTDHDEHKRIRR